MITISPSEITQLINKPGEKFLTICLPTVHHENGDAVNKATYRFLLHRAETLALQQGMSQAETNAFLAKTKTVLNDKQLWRQLGRGLMVLASQDDMHVCCLPFACEEKCVIGKHFYILPLIRWLNLRASYWMLLASQKHVRLLQVFPDSVHEVDVPDLPGTMADALHHATRDASGQFHSGNPQIPGKEGLVFTGQGCADDESDAEREAFARNIQKPISAFLKDKLEPLLFVGSKNLFAEYQRHNSYPQLCEQCIHVNPDTSSTTELRQQAQPLLDALQERSLGTKITEFWDQIAHGRTAKRIDEVLSAADSGAIETLFVDPNVHCFGKFCHITGQLRLDETPSPDSEDLVNLAAIFTLQHGGQVVVPSSGNIPGGGIMSATLRYPVCVSSSSISE